MTVTENDPRLKMMNAMEQMNEEMNYLYERLDVLVAERNRANRILAALREPSNAVILAADKKIPILYSLRDTKAAIIAAVETAEQEVGRE